MINERIEMRSFLFDAIKERHFSGGSLIFWQILKNVWGVSLILHFNDLIVAKVGEELKHCMCLLLCQSQSQLVVKLFLPALNSVTRECDSMQLNAIGMRSVKSICMKEWILNACIKVDI